ncbi:TetR/AcrR family transcriptional regulator [Brevibacterium atlanticum]|uniref:TetR/AcrR family transcriptional regulator n=1 Tax=Brevibacterium atlanticum TaxID=2697563 RepID=UPI00142417C3|nr:TetR family transcriptional regulator C-terminal domain-containing protein [Brevibacterium atlanticum]
MVRTIDADARRKLLADTVWGLLRKGGLEAASVRAVAKEAQLSAGSVRHFFSTQDELHVFAMNELMQRTAQNVEAAMRDAGTADSASQPAERSLNEVRAGLHQLLPIGDERTANFQTHLQFVVKAVIHPPLQATARDSYLRLQRFYEDCIDRLVHSGAAAEDLDRHKAAQQLAVVIDGLLLRRLTAPELVSTDDVIAGLDDHLSSLKPEGSS